MMTRVMSQVRMMREHRKYYDVVPAKAGTHNHQLCYFRRMSLYNRIQGV